MSATRLAPLAIGLLALAACTSTSPGAPSSSGTARIIAADTEPGSWLTHGRTYGEQRFSPLTHQHRDRRRLGLAWTYELDEPTAACRPPRWSPTA